jgi:hypothetical protein
MVKLIVSLSDEEDRKLEQYKAARNLSSKEKAIKSLIADLNISISVSKTHDKI